MPKTSGHFWWLPTSLSIVLSTLGILALARHAFVTWSLSAPLELVMAAYNAAMQLVFGWAHPYLQAALTLLGSFIGWRPTLYPHWRDVFIVVGLTGIGAGRAAWRASRIRTENVGLAIGLILGAAVTALTAGMLQLQSSDLITQLLIAASLGLVVLLLYVLSVFQELFREAVFRESLFRVADIGRLGIGLAGASVASAFAVLVTWLLSLVFGHVGGLGLAGMACVVVGLGLWLVGREIGQRWAEQVATQRRFNLRWGLNILGGFVGAAFVAAVDAGLKLLGA